MVHSEYEISVYTNEREIYMSRSYNVIPFNRNTLFLRNLEKILLNNNVLCKCQTKQFRKSCHEVLELVSVYLEDTKNQTNEQMSKWYEFDSLFSRYLSDRSNLSTNHKHQ